MVNMLKIHDKITPRCTNKKQYDLWREIHPSALSSRGFCDDCTPKFKREKCSQGLCDHPEVIFYKDKDGMIFGSHIAMKNKVAICS